MADRISVFQSVLFHGLLIMSVFLLQALSNWHRGSQSTMDFEVLQFPVQAQTLKIDQAPAKPVVPPKAETRQVFGANRNSLTASESSTESIDVKAGNTVAKAQDDLKLNAEDADQLPIPTDEFLVTSMPSMLGDFRVPYPEEARKAGIQGPVIMELLIDQDGKVRKVIVIKGPGYGLKEAAESAAKNFKFRPAKVSNEAVAVKIKYTYNFVLEER